MKPLILIILVVLSIDLFGQSDELAILPIDSITGKFTFTEIVNLDSTITKQELFLKAREWFAKSFNSATDVLKMDDKEAGILIGKGSFIFYGTSMGFTGKAGNFAFTISMYFKDGRYKYEITDILFNSDYMSNISCEHIYNARARNESSVYKKKVFIQFFDQLKPGIEDIIKDLKSSISKAEPSNKSNW